MIHQLAVRYRKPIATLLLLIFYVSVVAPVYAGLHNSSQANLFSTYDHVSFATPGNRLTSARVPVARVQDFRGVFGGGPSQPEMASFKSIGTDNMVNLFSGDFSYNIPLLDVGGYPVNIF